MSGLVVDLFAGGGGASVGIEAAIGHPVDIALNHDAVAMAVHKANHSETYHVEADIWEAKPLQVTRGRPVALLWASPDCFPAGTMILTDRGYRAIETIRRGDLVFTHNGRWRPVTTTMRSRKPLIEIRGHGHPGLRVSPEHPFYERHRRRKWNNARRSYDQVLDGPRWLSASKLTTGCYWAAPCDFAPLPVPEVGGRGMPLDARLMWLAGRYLGDGWTRLGCGRAELVIICGKQEAGTLRPLLSAWPRSGKRAGTGELAWSEREVRTAHQFATSHHGLVQWLRSEFGHGAAAKRVPGWALGMRADLRRALLDGYLSADGHQGPVVQDATTVSPALAFGIKALANSLGHTVAVYRNEKPNRLIEGRIVNARTAYVVRWRHQLTPDHSQVYREGGMEWCPVRESRAVAGTHQVYNLSVDEDESYVAEGLVVHNCTHFSVAKGGKPRKQNIRSLAWAVVRWADAVKPAVILLENVREFQGWGPLDPEGRPIKLRKGETFARWRRKLERLGYVVDYRVLDASQYGAPTKRRRLFLIARRDGRRIVWPSPTHGPGLLPVHTAAECIDWSIPCPSIFERKKPLAEKTMWRIAQGLKRFVLENPQPFVIKVNHGVDAKTGRREHPVTDPLTTVTARGIGHAVVVPSLVQTGYGEREGQAARTPDIEKPLGTVVAGGGKHALVAAFLAKHFSERPGKSFLGGQQMDLPMGTVTTVDHHALAAATLVKMRGQNHGANPREPMPTVTAGGTHLAEVRAFLTAYHASDYAGGYGQALDESMRTVTTKDRFGLVTVHGVDYQIVDIGMRMLEPHELLAAQFGRFAATYDLSAARTKTAKVRLIGNSVCPEVAEALVRANMDTAEVRAVA